MSADTLKLMEGFEATTVEQWRAVVQKALKGGDFEKRLVRQSDDGIRIDPLYRRRPEAASITRADAGAPWLLSARVDHPDAATASKQALEDLTNGVNSLTLVFPGSRSSRGFGLPCETLDDLDRALEGVGLEMITLRLDPAPAGRINAALVAALVEKRGYPAHECSIDFGMDPVGNLASRGMFAGDWPTLAQRIADAVSSLNEKGFNGPFLTCDTRIYHEAGASEAQDLAAALATGVAYLRALTGNGISPADAARAISFTIAVDADQFLGIAKLRALRRLWARVEEASGISQRPVRINAESAWRMMTRRDPWVNMLRGTMATFVAGIGGADSMTVLPHTSALGLPDAFARRIARNTQSVLMEESNVWRVADPVAGAGGPEDLTDALAEEAWRLFQEIEAEGGIVESLTKGALQGRISAKRTAREKDIARRKVQITGTSEFPLLTETPLEVLAVEPDFNRGIPSATAGGPTCHSAKWSPRLGAARAAMR